MLKRGWMNRYMSPIALQTAGDLATGFGYVWSALMFASAGLNLYLVTSNLNPTTWAAFISIYGIASKLTLFGIQYATMRLIGGRRMRAQLAAGGEVAGAAAAG